MKHRLFMLVWLAMLAFCSVVIGVLALLNYANAEVIFWTQKPIESEAGKIVWIVISAACLILFLVLAVREYWRKNDQSST
jgi:NADH:ubiquinone oxidoreductase subunit 5 (subunit L)/multisubunit Na+/H+ antiporter MnhA subunit